jgi:hypothetical protein
MLAAIKNTAGAPMNRESVELGLKLATLVGAAVTFAWGVYNFTESQRGQAETRRIEATKPFLDRQLTLYTSATQAAATLATSSDEAERAGALKRFWSLYWGELALVEDQRVEAAMVRIKDALASNASKEELQQRSLALAHACRDSLAESWGVKQWRSPY